MSIEEILTEPKWIGFFVESHRGKGWMNMAMKFDEGSIVGEGVDYVGPWYLQGTYSIEEKTCQWTKTYVGQHCVEYSGAISEIGIQGQWNIYPHLVGDFHIWPERMGHIQQEYLAELS